MPVTFNSTADTAEIAAENAVMLAQDLDQDVVLVWKGQEVTVSPGDRVSTIETLLLYVEPASPLAKVAAEGLNVLDEAWVESHASSSDDHDDEPRTCAPEGEFPRLFL